MSISVSYGGTSILQGIQPTTIECAQLADMGETATGAFTVEDDAAALTIIGYQPLTISESACSQPRLFTGWTFERGYQRDEENAILTGVARTHDVSIIDMNACFGFRQITRTGTGGGNRPAETWADRLTWILESEYLSDWISSDQSFVVTNTTMCDEADYRGSYPSAVLNDLSERSGDAYDYFAFWDPAAKEVRLFFDNANESIGDCVLRISNDLSEWDGWTTFAPDKVAKLQRESDQVYSDVCVNYKDGTLKLYRSRPSTYRTYVRRSTQIDRPYTNSAATATLQADAWLEKHSVEKDRVTCIIRVPKARVGLIQAGQRVQFKASHMPGYSAYVWMRVVMCTPKPADETASLYDIALELVGTPATTICCVAETPTPSGYYPPMGGQNSDATGNVAYVRAGLSFPTRPTPGYTGSWHFANYQEASYDPALPAVPTGWVDGPFGDSTNSVLCLVVGAGTMTVHTKRIFANGGYGTRTYTAEVWHENPDCAQIDPPVCCADLVADEIRTDIPVGTDAVFTIDPCSESCAAGYESQNPEGFCYHWVELKTLAPPSPGAAGHGGFAGFTWVSADSAYADTTTPLPPAPGATTTHTTDPTEDDDATAGYTVGSTWINTTDGGIFVLVDSTTGAAVWVETGLSGAPTTADYLVGTAQAGLSAEIVVGTTPGGELGGTWASPTIDATHSGSAHLALGSTSSTAAAGDHTHAGGISGEPFQITAVFDAGADAITGTPEVDVVIPAAGTLTGWTMMADASGTFVVDVWKDVGGNFPPTNADSITNGHEPTLSGAYTTDIDLSDWTSVALTAGDVIRFHVDSTATVKRVALTLTYTRS